MDSRRAAEGEAGKGLVETMEEKRVRLECLAPPYSPGKCGYQCVIFSRRGSYFVESVDRKNRIVHLTKTPSSKDSSFFHYFTRPVYYSLVDVTGHIARAPSLLGSSGGGEGGEGGSGGGEINDGVRRKGAADRGSRALIARSKAGGPAASGGKGYTGSNDSGVRFHGE